MNENTTTVEKAANPAYVLGDDQSAARRLVVLESVHGAASRELLEKAGWKAGWIGADIGCGTGLFALFMAEKAGPNGHVTGVDQSTLFLEMARRESSARGLDNVRWIAADATAPPLPQGSFDLVHARCLLSHLADPFGALLAMRRLLKPGGVLCLEDIDCGGVRSHPENPALMRHLELYQQAIRRHGGDPLLGRKLPRLCRRAGFDVEVVAAKASAAPLESVKRLYALTLEALKPTLLGARLADAAEVDAVAKTLHRFAADPSKSIRATPMVQVLAKTKKAAGSIGLL